MTLTDRQEKILNIIVKEYIKKAEPVGSEYLQKKYYPDICPATIRNEMKKLADEGYLYKSHISSGRIPTDKSYRLFVDRILERGLSYHFDFDDLFNDNIDNIHFFIRSLTKHISDMTKSFVMGYLVEDDFFWKDGLLEVIKEPEFNDRDYLLDFVNFLERLENDIDRLIEFKNNSGINVFIGEENPFPKAEKFAVIVSSCNLPKNGRNKKSIISVLGPKRMSYDRNIGLMISLLKELNKLEHG